MSATPRPWATHDANPEHLEAGIEPSWWIDIRSGDHTLAGVYGGSYEVNRADADLIVRAVNCHDELVAALTYARKCVDLMRLCNLNEQASIWREQVLAEIGGALAKVKGEPS